MSSMNHVGLNLANSNDLDVNDTKLDLVTWLGLSGASSYDENS